MSSNGQHKTHPAHFASEFMAGDVVLFQFAGLLTGRVNRVRFHGRKVTYQMTVAVECEVPASAVIGRESEVLGAQECEEGGSR
jgi:hypothetical protein